MSRRVDYFKAEEIAPADNAPGLYDFNVRFVPVVISAVEARKSRSFWATEDDFARGYNELCAIQEALLMSAAELIVNNIIAMRGIDPLAPRDAVTGVPTNPPTGSTLLGLFNTFQSEGVTPGDRLNFIGDNTYYTMENTRQGLLDEDGALLQALLLVI